MTKLFNYILVGALLIYSVSCVEWPQATLPEDKPLVQVDESDLETPPNVLDVNDGVLADFDKDISRWVVSHPQNINLERKGGVMVVHCNNVGPNWEEISLSFPPTSFANAKNVQLRARMDGHIIPTIRVDLVDQNGMQTNGKVSACKIAPREDFLNYQFRYDTHFIQGWPYKGRVDSTQIVTVRFNFNGGGTPYSGDIYFDELRAVGSFEE